MSKLQFDQTLTGLVLPGKDTFRERAPDLSPNASLVNRHN